MEEYYLRARICAFENEELPRGRLFYTTEELLKRPQMPGMSDRTLLYYHFRPARPADIVVPRDPDSGEIDFTPRLSAR